MDEIPRIFLRPNRKPESPSKNGKFLEEKHMVKEKELANDKEPIDDLTQNIVQEIEQNSGSTFSNSNLQEREHENFSNQNREINLNISEILSNKTNAAEEETEEINMNN